MHLINKTILELYQARKTKKQKKAFRDYLTQQLDLEKIPYSIEKNGKIFQSHNIVIGDKEKATLFLSAHYDTAPILPFPNLIYPLNLGSSILVQTPILIIFFIFFSIIYPLINDVLKSYILTIEPGIFRFIAITFGAICVFFIPFIPFYILFFGKTNKHTANDNTSGIITLLECILTHNIDLTHTCIILLDHEETGLNGSARFIRENPILKDKLVLNYDCVSDGDTIYFKVSKKTNDEIMKQLHTSFVSTEQKTILITKKGMYPSDNINFPISCGIAALRTGKLGLHIPNLHTAKDTAFDITNIEYLSKHTVQFSEYIKKEL